MVGLRPVFALAPCGLMHRNTGHRLLVTASLFAIILIQFAATNMLVICQTADGHVVLELNCDGKPESCAPTVRGDSPESLAFSEPPCIDTTVLLFAAAPNIGDQRARSVVEVPMLPVFYLPPSANLVSHHLPRFNASNDSERLTTTSAPDLLRSVVILI